MKPHSHTRHAEPLKRVGIIAKARGASRCLLCLRENNARSNPAPRQMPRLFFIGSSSKKNARLFPAITTQAWRHFRINLFSPDSTSEHCSCSMSLLILCGAPPHPYLNINMTPTLFSLCFMFYAKMKHDAFPAHKKTKVIFCEGKGPHPSWTRAPTMITSYAGMPESTRIAYACSKDTFLPSRKLFESCLILREHRSENATTRRLFIDAHEKDSFTLATRLGRRSYVRNKRQFCES